MPTPPPATAAEKYGIRIDIGTSGQTVDVPYLVTGASSRDAARAAIIATAPETITGYDVAGTGTPATLYRLSVGADEEASATGVWNGSAKYGLVASSQRSTGEWAFQFETGGGTQHITNALKHISSTKCAGVTGAAPDHKGAINVNGEGEVGGCEIISPVFRFAITAYHANSAVTQAKLNALYQLTGKVNAASTAITVNGYSLVFAAGELLYEGASGGQRGNQDWEITYRLSASPNSDDICALWDAAVKPAAAVAKKGWEYAWVEYQENFDDAAKTLVRRPLAVHVEQVYQIASFADLNIP